MQTKPIHAARSANHSANPIRVSSRYFHPHVFSTVTHTLFCLYCFAAALSIAATQLLLVPVALYWFAFQFYHLRNKSLFHPTTAISSLSLKTQATSRTSLELALPVAAWFAVCFISSLVGVDPTRSLAATLKSTLYLILPFVVLTSLRAGSLGESEFCKRVRTYIILFIAGQSIAAIHSLLEASFHLSMPPKLPGPVTESGQLALLLPMLLALIFAFSGRKSQEGFPGASFRALTLQSGLLFISLLVFSWPHLLLESTRGFVQIISALTSLIVCFTLIGSHSRQITRAKSFFKAPSFQFNTHLLLWASSSLLFAAAVVNLKRGPWLGIFVELFLIGLFLTKRLALATVVVATLLLLIFSPARTRVVQFGEDFSISGGRKTMWALGAELVERNPLGIGVANARYMREIIPSLPDLHRHMHSNLLNVAVETGWLGLVVYLWWMFAIIRLGVRTSRKLKKKVNIISRQLSIISLCSAISLLGWQVAGLVEYNFGDAEVRLMALFIMGIILAIASYEQSAQQTNT